MAEPLAITFDDELRAAALTAFRARSELFLARTFDERIAAIHQLSAALEAFGRDVLYRLSADRVGGELGAQVALSDELGRAAPQEFQLQQDVPR